MMEGKVLLFNFLSSLLLNIRSKQDILVAQLVDRNSSLGSGKKRMQSGSDYQTCIDRVSYFLSIPKTMFQTLPCKILGGLLATECESHRVTESKTPKGTQYTGG